MAEPRAREGSYTSGSGPHHGVPGKRAGLVTLGEADEREVPQRRHRAPLDELHLGRLLGPLRVAPPGEFRSPAELARGRCKPALQRTAQPRLRTNAAHQYNLATRLENAGELVECCFRVRHRGDDILSDHDIE